MASEQQYSEQSRAVYWIIAADAYIDIFLKSDSNESAKTNTYIYIIIHVMVTKDAMTTFLT